jgi:hypothetical protein
MKVDEGYDLRGDARSLELPDCRKVLGLRLMMPLAKDAMRSDRNGLGTEPAGSLAFKREGQGGAKGARAHPERTI